MELTQKQVNKAIESLEWSTAYLAHRLDVTTGTIENWKSGRAVCRGPAAKLIMRFVREKTEPKLGITGEMRGVHD